MHRYNEHREPEKSINTRFLHMQLIRIDLMIRKSVRCWELAGQDFSEKFRGLFITEKNIQDLLNRPIGGNWGVEVILPAQEDEQFKRLQIQVEEEISRIRAEAKQSDINLRLDQIMHLFDLSWFEFDAFLI